MKLNLNIEFLENLQEIYFILDKKNEIIKYNKEGVNKYLINFESFKRTNFFDLVAPGMKDISLVALNDSRKENIIKSVISKLKFDEKIVPVKLVFSPCNSEILPEADVLLLARKITPDDKSDLDFSIFYYVAENSVNPLQITDINGRMIYVNPAFIEASGFTKEELVGQRPSVFSSGKHSKKFWNKMWTTISNGKEWVGDVENKRKNGEPFYTQLLISPIISPGGNVTGYFGVHRDLSEKRILEKQLVHTQKMESIGTLAAGIAHEVGNPLASISAIVQVVQRSTDDPFVIEKLSLVKSQITRISKIIRDLVDFSRPSNYELKVTDINKNITEAVEITKVGAKAKNMNFELNLNNSIPLLPLISDQLQQIFVNILLNAVDAITDVQEFGKEQKISVTTDRNDDDVIIIFSDTGTGIKEEFLSKVFEPFFTTKKEGKGTGLGLWVSYGIIKSFQGDIKVESTLGKGTTFTISIPIQP